MDLKRITFEEVKQLKSGDIFVSVEQFPSVVSVPNKAWIVVNADKLVRLDGPLAGILTNLQLEFEDSEQTVDGRYKFYNINGLIDMDAIEAAISLKQNPGKLSATSTASIGGWVSNETSTKTEATQETAQIDPSLWNAQMGKLDRILRQQKDIFGILSKINDRINLNSYVESDNNDDTKESIRRSNVLMGYFCMLGDQGFPIRPTRDDVTCIPANTTGYVFNAKEGTFSEKELNNYTVLKEIWTITQIDGITWGSPSYGLTDNAIWYNLDDIKHTFTSINKIKPISDTLYKFPTDEYGYPCYISIYTRNEKDKFFKFERKEDVSGLKDITIIDTCISYDASDKSVPVAYAQIRCRDDELFTGCWIRFDDLVKM